MIKNVLILYDQLRKIIRTYNKRRKIMDLPVTIEVRKTII